MKEEEASYGLKQSIFVLFDIPAGLIAILLMAIILIVFGGFIVCGISSNSGDIQVGSLAVCGETFIPFLIWPAPWIFLISFVVGIILLVKYYKKLEEKVLSRNSAILRGIIGIPLWLIVLWLGYYSILALLDMRG